MARRAARKFGPESLLEIIKRVEAQAAQARAEAAADEEVNPWDLLDLDPAVSDAAWARYLGKPAR
jgi:hypothetical protein